VSALGSVAPLIVGVAGILIGRKTKVAIDELRFADLTKRIVSLEGIQSNHVVVIARMQQNINFVQRALARIEDTAEENGKMTEDIDSEPIPDGEFTP
jgi:hypothetical protein